MMDINDISNISNSYGIQSVQSKKIKKSQIAGQSASKVAKSKREEESKALTKISKSKDKGGNRDFIKQLSSLSGLDAMLSSSSSRSSSISSTSSESESKSKSQYLKLESQRIKSEPKRLKKQLSEPLNKLEARIQDLNNNPINEKKGVEINEKEEKKIAEMKEQKLVEIIQTAQQIVRDNGPNLLLYDKAEKSEFQEFDRLLNIVNQIPYHDSKYFSILQGFIYSGVRRSSEQMFVIDLKSIKTKTNSHNEVIIKVDDETFKDILENRIADLKNPDLKLSYLKCFLDRPIVLSHSEKQIITKLQTEILKNIDLSVLVAQTKGKTIENAEDWQLRKWKNMV